MKRFMYITAVSVSLVSLSGCGWLDFEEREPWRAEVEARCLASKTVVVSDYIRPMPMIKGPRVCGVDHPFHVTGLNGGQTSVAPRARLGCAMVPALEQWMRETIQPAAMALYGVQVVEVKNMASYGCRPRNNQKGAPLSEHSFANALDIGAFRFADGREITVKSGWKGAPDEQMFLRQALAGACKSFTTVLGPGSDAFHYDHFHLDLRMHDPRGMRRVCKPVPAPDTPVAGTPLPHLAVMQPLMPQQQPAYDYAAPPVTPQQAYPSATTPQVMPPYGNQTYGHTPMQTPAQPSYNPPQQGNLTQVPAPENDPFAYDPDATGSITSRKIRQHQ